MNWILMNVLITTILVGALAAIAYYVVKPVLRKKFFNTPGVIELIRVDDEISILFMDKPYRWFAGFDDFEKYAKAMHKIDRTIDVLCYPSNRNRNDTVVTCYAQAEENTRYDFQKIVKEEAGIFGVKSMVLLPIKPTKEELIALVKTARID